MNNDPWLGDPVGAALQTNGTTPLIAACRGGHLAIAKILLDRGASHAHAKVFVEPLGYVTTAVAAVGGFVHVLCTSTLCVTDGNGNAWLDSR